MLMRRVFAASTISALLFVSTTAAAQTPADDIRAQVKDGLRVSVTDDQGRDFKGRIIRLTSDVLTIAKGRERTDIPYTDIVKIDHVDTLKNGALIGLGVGSVMGVLMVLPSDCEPGSFFCGDPGPGNYVAGALFLGGLGAAVGTGIDALIGGRRNIYQRGGRRISLSPTVRRDGTGAVLSLRW